MKRYKHIIKSWWLLLLILLGLIIIYFIWSSQQKLRDIDKEMYQVSKK